MADPLVTVTELETFLQRDVDPEAGTLAVASASGIIRDYCRWAIAPVTETKWTLDGRDTTVLNLPTLHLADVGAVWLNGAPISDYEWSVRGQLYRTAGWSAPMRGIEIYGSHGYESTPDTVRAVALTLASRIVGNPEGLRSKSVGGISKSYIFETMRGDLSELQFTQIGGYRLP